MPQVPAHGEIVSLAPTTEDGHSSTNCTRLTLGVLLFLFVALPPSLWASPIPNVVGPPVDHPALSSAAARTSAAWRREVEGFAESVTRASLEMRGFTVSDVKTPRGHGIDLLAVRRDAAGRLVDMRFIEVKGRQAGGRPALGMTQSGEQMSRRWLAEKLRQLRAMGPGYRELARDIGRLHRQSGMSLVQFGEIHEINVARNSHIIRNPAGGGGIAALNLERELREIRRRGQTRATRNWAVRHLAEFDQLRAARMHPVVSGATVHSRAPVSRSLDGSRARPIDVRRAVVRGAGPLGAAVSLAIEAHELYGHTRRYREGQISRREYTIVVSRTGGRIAGAAGGAAGGAWIGAKAGALGGPLAPITVPAGGILGGAIGGIAGYFGGGAAGEALAESWFAQLDERVRRAVDEWVLAKPVPDG